VSATQTFFSALELDSGATKACVGGARHIFVTFLALALLEVLHRI
jgi:hypothetical protein